MSYIMSSYAILYYVALSYAILYESSSTSERKMTKTIPCNTLNPKPYTPNPNP